MKKTIVLLLSFIVIGCALWYGQGMRKQRAQTLIWAAYDGDLTAVKNALEDGAETDWVLPITDKTRHYNQAEFFPLLAAASGGNEKVLQHLLKQGLDVNQSNNLGWTPLFIAAREGHAEFAAQLISKDANPNMQTDTGATALMMVIVSDFKQKDRLDLLEYMLKRKADPNLQTKLGTDALFYTVTELKNKKALQLLLQHKADPCRLYEGKTLLQLAKEDKKSADLVPALKEAMQSCPAH